ncbi:MAG: M42 family metallopeptidase [Gudongella sp.]|nr:M42 family metallopeptidase [Gudongella sp.]
MEVKDFLSMLSNGNGISGFEYRIKDTIIDAFREYSDEIEVDRLGNIIALKKGTGNGKIKIMIAAHMDEIGLMVKAIENNGFLRFTSIGGIDPRTILGQEVMVHGKDSILGVVGSKPPHLQTSEEQKKTIQMEDMIIDLGFTKERVSEIVEIGDTITINRKMIDLLNNRVSGKAMDDRAGLASLYELLKMLHEINHFADIYIVATVQEEVTMSGAFTSSYRVNPDIGIAVDVGFGATPELAKSDSLELGEGPGITLGGNIHPGLRKKLIEVSKEFNIKTQMDVDAGPTGTDARAIQITREGIPALVVSIPLRYMHTSVEVLDLDDVFTTAKLLAFYINSIKNEDELEALLCY